MNDKELGKRHLVNLHGIRFHITGDPTSEEAKKRIHAAKLDVGQLKITHPVPIARLERPGKYEIRGTHGRYEVSMTIPEAVEKVEEKKVRKVLEEGYTFVPAIAIATEDVLMEGHGSSFYWVGLETLVDFSLCGSSDWSGSMTVVEDISMPWSQAYYPGCTYSRKGQEGIEHAWIEVFSGMAVRGCTNWGRKDAYPNFDWEDEATESSSDTGFVPGPAVGPLPPYENYGVAYSAMKHKLLETGPLHLGFHIDSGEADRLVCHACHYDHICSPPGWSCREWHWNDGYWYDYCCEHPEGFPCYFRRYTDTGLLAWFSACSYSYLWFAYKVIAWQEQWYYPDMWAYMGFCFSGDVEILENVTKPGDLILDEEVGGANTREAESSSATRYWGVNRTGSGQDWSDLRSGGDIPDWDWNDLGNAYELTHSLSQPSMCTQKQCDTYKFHDIYPIASGFTGAFIQDVNDGEEAHVCPIKRFSNLHFEIVPVYHYHHEYDYCDSRWKVSGVGYDGDVWQDGTVGSLSGVPSSADTRLESYYVLLIILNGKIIEIDRSDDYGDEMTERSDEFSARDSLILDFMGTPVYMYSYSRRRRNPDTGKYFVLYTRYGYFLNDKHYQSEKFEPAGVTCGGHLYDLHDVAGSAKRGKYGFGQCAGFIVKNTFEREIPA